MKTLFRITIAASALIATALTAQATDDFNAIEADVMGITSFMGEPDMLLDITEPRPLRIGVARLDHGRLISTPTGEAEDWHFLDKRTKAEFTPISASAYLKNVPEIAYGEHDTWSKIDEVRMTAADEKMDYVVVYSVGRDAEWADLGGTAFAKSGLTAPLGSASYRNASGKAVLIDTYTGSVYGAVISDETEFGVGDLTDQVQEMIENLDATLQPKV